MKKKKLKVKPKLREYWVIETGGYPAEAYFNYKTALKAQEYYKTPIIHVRELALPLGLSEVKK